MKSITYLTLILTFISASVMGQYKQDAEAIKSMCGCYEIKFNFSETFASDKDYEFHDNYLSGGLEWVFPVEDEKGKIVFPFRSTAENKWRLSRHFCEYQTLSKERPVRKIAWISLVSHMPMTFIKTDDEVAAPGRTLQCTEL